MQSNDTKKRRMIFKNITGNKLFQKFIQLDQVNCLPFNPGMIQARKDKPNKVMVPVKDLIRLYKVLFDIEKKQRCKYA